jgi:hypothetical protein
MEQWATGGFASPIGSEFLIKNATGTGYCNALQEVSEMDYDRMKEILSNEQ